MTYKFEELMSGPSWRVLMNGFIEEPLREIIRSYHESDDGE